MALKASLVVLAAAAASSAALPAPLPLECALSVPASVAAGQAVPLRLRLRNAGPVPVQVLTWGTPFEGWFAPYVRVWRNDTELRYQGPSLKRGDPEREDYLRLAAGRARIAVVDLSQAFDLGRSGRYRVVPQLTVHDVFVATAATPPRPRDRHAGQTLACAPLVFEIPR
jgi:hypothetical protein